MPYGTINADLMTTSDGVSSSGLYGFKNRLINSAMVIDQRGGVAVSANNEYAVDRWKIFKNNDGVATIQQSSDAPTGFKNSLIYTVTTADTNLTTIQQSNVVQVIEGYNMADLMWGTANAQTVTLSFWVKSSLTGTFGGTLRNGPTATYSHPYSYTISAANTWEYKTVTVTGATAGTWNTTTSDGIQLLFGMGAGPDRSGTAGVWAATNYTTATGAVSVIGTLGATWQVSGVQLEKGSTATSFDYRSYGTELALCQRYFQRLGSLSGNYVAFGSGRGSGGTTVFCYFKYTTPVRTTPTLTQSNTGINNPSQVTVTGFGSVYYGSDGAGVELTTGSTTGSGVACLWVGNNNSSAYVDISAEL